MLTATRHILEMIRFSHTLFALPFALLAFLMAAYLPIDVHESSTGGIFVHDSYLQLGRVKLRVPDWFLGVSLSPYEVPSLQQPGLGRIFLGILLCMVFARSAAMAFNRLADAKIDADNPRTSKRHIPAGILSKGQVIAFCVVCAVGFIASTLLFWPNWLPLALSVPVLLFLCGYSYAKRFTSLAHFWLGTALMLAPICAWIALRGQAVLSNPADLVPAVILGAAVLLWVSGFDIIYACQDAAFDRAAGLRSVPAKLGVARALHLAAICHLGMVLLLAVLPWFYPQFGWIYWSGVAVVALLLIYEHSLVRPNDLARVNQAFFNVNAVVSLGLLAVAALDLLT